MSNAHKGSRLILRDQLIPVDFSSAHFNFNMDAIGVQYGDIVQPSGASIYSLRQVEGKFGSGIAVEEGTTNLIETQGGGASQDWTKWSHYGNTTYWTTNSQFDDPKMGKVFQGSNTGNAQAFLYDYYPYTFTSGSVYTNSIYLKASYNLPTLAFNSYINSSSGGQHNIANSVNFTGISTQWTRYTATHTITQQANGVGGIGWSLGTLPSGCIIYASMPQLENKAFATSFVQGTRATGVLNYPIELLNPYEGTISFWWKPSSYWDYDTKGANHERILYTGNPDIAHDYFQIGRYSSSDTIRTLIQIGGSSKSLQFSTTETGGMNIYNNYHFICVKWSVSNNEYALFFDGVKKTTTMPVGRIDWSGFPLYLGTRDGQQPMNAIINELRIDNVAKTDEEITSWYIANKPFYNPYDYRGYAY